VKHEREGSGASFAGFKNGDQENSVLWSKLAIGINWKGVGGQKRDK
jgi:hypothetical protein